MATGGNLSVRIANQRAFAITPSNYDYMKMTPDDVCVLDPGLQRLEGQRQPSVESALHAGIYEARPDVMMVDFQLPGIDGLELVRSARQIRPELRALVLSSLIAPLALTRLRESGVEGYVEKDASPAELEEALTSVAQGRVWFSKKYQATLAQEGARAAAVGKILSRREQEVLGHVLSGKTSREIGELIGLSARTVEFHRANVMGKLGATNLAELVANARRRGVG